MTPESDSSDAEIVPELMPEIDVTELACNRADCHTRHKKA